MLVSAFPGADDPVRVGFVGSIGRSRFSDLLLHAAPSLDTAYSSGSRRALFAALATRKLDMAVVPIRPGTAGAGADLCRDRFVAVMARSHPLAARRDVAIGDLGRHPLVVAVDGAGGDLRRLVREYVPAVTTVEERAAAATRLLLHQGDTIAIAPESDIAEIDADCAVRPIVGVDASFVVKLTWRAGATIPGLPAILAALGSRGGEGAGSESRA